MNLQLKQTMQEPAQQAIFATHIEKIDTPLALLIKNDAAKKIWISLVQELEEMGISKKMIALHSHISLKTIQRLENGRVKAPTHYTFKKLLAFYCSVTVVK